MQKLPQLQSASLDAQASVKRSESERQRLSDVLSSLSAEIEGIDDDIKQQTAAALNAQAAATEAADAARKYGNEGAEVARQRETMMAGE